MGYERFVLILDSEHTNLGKTAVRLVQMGVDTLYAKDVDEAVLLAAQESSRLGAILVSTRLVLESGEEQLLRVWSQLPSGAAGLVLVGEEPDPAVLVRLHERGARWCLWEPYDERDLRFVTTEAMATGYPGNRRKHPRVPTAIETTVFMGRHPKQSVVHDLSMGGAFMAAEDPFLEGSRLSLDIGLPGGRVIAKGEVVMAQTRDKLVREDTPEGMGIVFKSFAGASEELLRDFVRGWMRRFQL